MLEDITELLHRQPFEPFVIVTNSGRAYEVDNPDSVALGKSRLGIFPPGTDKWVTIRLTEISALESKTAA